MLLQPYVLELGTSLIFHTLAYAAKSWPPIMLPQPTTHRPTHSFALTTTQPLSLVRNLHQPLRHNQPSPPSKQRTHPPGTIHHTPTRTTSSQLDV